MQKIEARKWYPSKEIFDHYAIDKLALMNNLNLPVVDMINLLTGGITHNSVRCTALSIKASSVESFLDEMRHIIEGLPDLERKQHQVTSKRSVAKDDTCRNCSKKGHTHLECRSKITCFFCKTKGHRQYDCPEAKKKETKGVHPGKEQQTVAAVAEEKAAPATQSVATIKDFENEIDDDDARVSVIEINGTICELSALIDTGSPVSFLRLNIYNKFVNSGNLKLMKSSRRLSNISGGPLDIVGVAEIELKFDPLQKVKIKIEFCILRNNLEAIIIDRDFFKKQIYLCLFTVMSGRGRAD